MKKRIADCGLDCEECDAFKATLNNDDALRVKVAKLWSDLNGVEITPQMINCEGCRADGIKTPFCDSLCSIRQCAMHKPFETCGCCYEMQKCQKVNKVIFNNTTALKNLKLEWFTIDKIDDTTYIISEYRHWEETHCYLLIGKERCLLIDTGLGICNIYDEVRKLTNKPVTAVATHIHWDHIGGHKYFSDFYAHKAEIDWLNGKFPLSKQTIQNMVIDRCNLPEGYDVSKYELFQGRPTKLLHGNEMLDLGDRKIKVLHTPGHSPGHLCFWEEERGYIFTGDLIYKDTLFAYYPSTDPKAYLHSLEMIAALPAKRLFPAHHSLDIQPEIAIRIRNAFQELKAQGKLHHGAGIFNYGDWAVWL